MNVPQAQPTLIVSPAQKRALEEAQRQEAARLKDSMLQSFLPAVPNDDPDFDVAPPKPKAKPAAKGLDDLTKDELLEMAEARGLEVTRRTSKLKLLAMLRESQE